MQVASESVRVCPSVSQTVVQHLLGTCHSRLHSSSHSIKVTSLCSPKGARQPPDRTANTAAEREGAFFNKDIQKIWDTVCYYRAAFFPKNQRGRQLKKASVSAELSLALWLKLWQPSVSGKTPLALRQSAAACWAGRLRDGLQQTHEEKGCPSQMRYGEFSGKEANIC